MDCNGLFEKLWQFSAYMVSKGFKVYKVNRADDFIEGDMPKVEIDNEHVILRACMEGEPNIFGNDVTVECKTYRVL